MFRKPLPWNPHGLFMTLLCKFLDAGFIILTVSIILSFFFGGIIF
jgi:hypothetical protein